MSVKTAIIAVGAGAALQTISEVAAPPTPHHDFWNANGSAALLGTAGGGVMFASAAVGLISVDSAGLAEGMKGVKVGGAFVAGVAAARAVGAVIGARQYGAPPA